MYGKTEVEVEFSYVGDQKSFSIGLYNKKGAIEYVEEDKSLNPGKLLKYISFENVENFLFSSNDVLKIPKLYEEFKDKKKLKCAILIGNRDMHFGIGRMMQNIFEMNNLVDDFFVVHNDEEAEKLIKKIID